MTYEKDHVYIGANYHPHDISATDWENDIKEMKNHGIEMVRIGHLCWDSFEPSEGNFQFEWFDTVIKLFQKYQIKVFIDIPTRPAPLWLHTKFPSINIWNVDGIMMQPITRYMEDVGDPNFQKYALLLTSRIVKRYHNSSNLLGFGLCNEIGSGFSSYSPTALFRFQLWLQNRYESIDNLNLAWATQRWSRRLSKFSEVSFPINSLTKGSPESYLDMKRFFSDELGAYLVKLQKAVKEIDSRVKTSSNHWAENTNVGFDYQKYYSKFVDVPGIGFYPGINPEDKNAIIGVCMNTDYRVSETNQNIWGLEFQTGTNGGYSAPVGAYRMYAYLSMVYRNAMICNWTWKAMRSGEEQYFYGLLDHSGQPTTSMIELDQVSGELERLKSFDIFPRSTNPRIAIATSYDSNTVTGYSQNYYQRTSLDQLKDTYKALFQLNIDCNIVDLKYMKNEYDLVIVPGIAVMDKISEQKIRDFVRQGGTVIMTGYSSKVDEQNQVFDTPLPGNLTDVFGVRVKGFERAYTAKPTINEGGVEKNDLQLQRHKVNISVNGSEITKNIDYYEYLQCSGAKVIGSLVSDGIERPAITMNKYGQGKAIYIATPAITDVLKYMLDDLGFASFESDSLVVRKLSNELSIIINYTDKIVNYACDKNYSVLIGDPEETLNGLTLNPYDVVVIKYTSTEKV
jgi:beta-galactosidase